eukprot:3483869-Prymnesium_polylepis.1
MPHCTRPGPPELQRQRDESGERPRSNFDLLCRCSLCGPTGSSASTTRRPPDRGIAPPSGVSRPSRGTPGGRGRRGRARGQS